MTSSTVSIPVRGPFSLSAAVDFLAAFGGAMTHSTEPAADGGARLRLAFPVEGHWSTAGAVVRADGGAVVAEIVGTAPPGTVAAQVARILSLDINGSEFPAVGRRDPVIGALQARFPGLRPVCFWSPYEAAAWALIGQRISMRQAAAVKGRMAAELGQPVELDGRLVPAFPAPQRLAELTGFPGLSDRKVGWLRSLAEATMAGRLDADRLRSQPRADALTGLQTLDGIGPFSAELILLRGAGDPDAAPRQERRLLAAVAAAYGVAGTAAELARVAERWRPYRTWASVLMRAGWGT